nr:uncharacterized protein LOC116156398 [Camelus dromedarius]
MAVQPSLLLLAGVRLCLFGNLKRGVRVPSRQGVDRGASTSRDALPGLPPVGSAGGVGLGRRERSGRWCRPSVLQPGAPPAVRGSAPGPGPSAAGGSTCSSSPACPAETQVRASPRIRGASRREWRVRSGWTSPYSPRPEVLSGQVSSPPRAQSLDKRDSGLSGTSVQTPPRWDAAASESGSGPSRRPEEEASGRARFRVLKPRPQLGVADPPVSGRGGAGPPILPRGPSCVCRSFCLLVPSAQLPQVRRLRYLLPRVGGRAHRSTAVLGNRLPRQMRSLEARRGPQWASEPRQYQWDPALFWSMQRPLVFPVSPWQEQL